MSGNIGFSQVVLPVSKSQSVIVVIYIFLFLKLIDSQKVIFVSFVIGYWQDLYKVSAAPTNSLIIY